MSELSVPEPLSGTEVIDAVAYRVKEMLFRDCFLSANSAYEAFSCKIKIEIAARDCGRTVEVNQDISVQAGNPSELEHEDTMIDQAEALFEEAPPNVVRAETEQPVPVMTEDYTGHTERKTVKYKKRERETAKA